MQHGLWLLGRADAQLSIHNPGFALLVLLAC
jgi:hypothetical protein